MFREVLQESLDAELDEALGYGKYDYTEKLTIKSVSTETLVNSATGEQITHDLYRTDSKIYSMPSDTFKTVNSMDKDTRTSNYLTMNALISETYDTNISRFVNSFKNYSVGDTMIFKDQISNIVYDQDINATKFTFVGIDNDAIDWYFNGDLTSEYHIGENLNLKFKIVNEYEDENVNCIFALVFMDWTKNNGYT